MQKNFLGAQTITPEKFNMADFLHENSWFFGSGIAE
jgi:hypothetical protein